MLLVPFVLILGGCSDVQELVGGLFGDDAPPAQSAGPSAPTPPPSADPLDPARKALRGDKADEALAAAEKAVAATPTSDEAWDMLEVAARRGKQAGAALDHLSADTAIGGRVDRHQALRARLALEAGRPADALAAARALEATSPGDAAVYAARAVKAGATAPPDLPPAAAALVAALGNAAAPLPPEVEALPGLEAAVIRAELAVARGATPAALPADPAPLAVRSRALAFRLAHEPAAGAVDEALAVATAAAGLGDVVGAADTLAGAVPAAAGAGKIDAVVKAATDLRTSATEAKAGGAALASVAAAVAEGSLRSGQPLQAREAAAVAAAQAATKSRGQWALALSSALLGDVDGVRAAATGLPGDRLKAVQDLASALAGLDPSLPSAGLTGDDAALQVLAAVGWLGSPGPACQAALAQARGADLRTWAQLACSRAPVEVAPDAPAPLRSEMMVRSWLAGGAGGALADSTHPNAAGWGAALGGGTIPAGPGVAAIGRYRAALAAGDSAGASTALADAAAVLPAWRSGPLAPLLALDGPVAAEVLPDATKVAGLADPVATGVALHGWAHRAASSARMWTHGVAPFDGATPVEDQAAVFDAAARLRAATIAWAMGSGPWPAEAATALDAAAKKAKLSSAPLPSLTKVREALTRSAVLSFLDLPGSVQLLVVTDEGGAVRGYSERVASDVREYTAALAAGGLPIALGDRVRGGILDPAQDVLAGIGSYVVVGGAGTAMIPVGQLPEQSDGLRWLSAIRHSTHLPDFDLLTTPYAPAQEYPVTALAFCATPEEAEITRRSWPDVTTKVGAEATVAAWRELAPKARYLHLGGFPEARGGGFQLPGGEVLSLHDLASPGSRAMSAVIVGPSGAETALARAQALRTGGVGDVLATLWSPAPMFRDTLIGTYWDGVNRRRAPSRAFDDGRTQAVKLVGEEAMKPDAWGGYLILSGS